MPLKNKMSEKECNHNNTTEQKGRTKGNDIRQTFQGVHSSRITLTKVSAKHFVLDDSVEELGHRVHD